ncbi:P-type conjugative transfer protein TrbL [Helicobacter pylori]
MQGSEIEKNADIFKFISDLFIAPSKNLAWDLAENMNNLFHTQLSLNIILSILFMIWAYRRIKEGDMFEFKTAMGVVVFVAFLMFLNFGINNSKVYMTKFYDFLTIPANALGKLVFDTIDKVVIANGNSGISTTLGTLVNKTYYTITQLYNAVFHDLGWRSFFALFPSLVVFILLILAQSLFLALVMIIVLLVSVEIFIWLSLGIMVLPLGLFPQTKGMLFSYLKKLISLTFYQPCMTLVAFFNLQALQLITIRIPSQDEIRQGFFGDAHKMIDKDPSNLASAGFTDIIGYFFVLILISVICFYLVKRVPDFINNIFGTSGGVGAVTEMMQKIGMTIGGAVVGGSMVMVANQAKQAYQSAGGGLAGLQAGARAIFGAGLSGGITTMANAKGAKAGVRHFVASVKSGFGLDNDRNNK